MENLHFPLYSYRVFKEEELEYDIPDDLKQLNRYDYINLTNITSNKAKQKMLSDLLSEYLKVQEEGFEYKDHILDRYYYKQFVIRETTDDESQTRYYKYTLSDWDEASKKDELDDRTIAIDIYSKNNNDDSYWRDASFKLKVGHKHELMNQVDDILMELDEQVNGKEYDSDMYTTEKNLYVVPLYFNIHPINDSKHESFHMNHGPSYTRVSILKGNYSVSMCRSIFSLFQQAMYRFCIFNLYMINKIEMNEEMIFVDTNDAHYESDNMIDYIKRHPFEDKHVLIRDFKYNISIKMDPSRKNIYSRDNKTIRTLCDYQHQVHGHYQRYWYGSEKDGTRHVEWVWKDAYSRNDHKLYRVIKEHEKEEDI